MSQRPDSIEPGTRGPGYERAPDHRVALIPSGKHVVVKMNGEVIADSHDVVFLEENNYPARAYIARDDVRMEALEKMDGKSTYCPFKGLTEYFSAGGTDDVAWSYVQPYREAEVLRDRICFDADQVEEKID